MAGEPARALVTDQITSSSAIPDEDDSRRAMAVTAAVAAAIPAAIEGVLNGASLFCGHGFFPGFTRRFIDCRLT